MDIKLNFRNENLDQAPSLKNPNVLNRAGGKILESLPRLLSHDTNNVVDCMNLV